MGLTHPFLHSDKSEEKEGIGTAKQGERIMGEPLSFTIHRTWLALESNEGAFLAYAREHLADLLSSPVGRPDIQARLHWGRELVPMRASVNGYHRLGRRLLRDDNEIVQTEILSLPGLQLQTSLTETGLCIDAGFRPPSNRMKRILALGGKSDQAQIYDTLICYLVYFPLLWYIERARQMYPIHASAVAWPQGAVILAGLGGVGRSTTTLAFLSDPDARLLSENLILYDKTRVYAFPEPICLDNRSRALLISLNGRLKPTGRSYPRNRQGYKVPTSARVQSATPRLFCSLRQGRDVDLSLISAEKALAILMSSDMLARELNEYAQQAAAFNLLSSGADSLQQRIESLKRLLKRIPCYELTIKPDEDLSNVVALVRDKLQW